MTLDRPLLADLLDTSERIRNKAVTNAQIDHFDQLEAVRKTVCDWEEEQLRNPEHNVDIVLDIAAKHLEEKEAEFHAYLQQVIEHQDREKEKRDEAIREFCSADALSPVS